MSADDHIEDSRHAVAVLESSSYANGKKLVERRRRIKTWNAALDAAAALFDDLKDRFPGQHRARILALKKPVGE